MVVKASFVLTTTFFGLSSCLARKKAKKQQKPWIRKKKHKIKLMIKVLYCLQNLNYTALAKPRILPPGPPSGCLPLE